MSKYNINRLADPKRKPYKSKKTPEALEFVMKLHEKGVSYQDICGKLYTEMGIETHYLTIRNWIKTEHNKKTKEQQLEQIQKDNNYMLKNHVELKKKRYKDKCFLCGEIIEDTESEFCQKCMPKQEVQAENE